MNAKLIILVLLMATLLGCKEEGKIEIVPNLEAEYLSEGEVATPLEFNSEQNDSTKDGSNDLIAALKSIHDSQNKDSIRYKIRLRLYVNENGRVDKVKDISNMFDRSEYCEDGVKNYTDRDKLNKALTEKFENFKFEPAMKYGEKVKSWIDLKGMSVLATPDDKFQIELNDFLAGMFGSKDKYFISADDMPEPVGGIVSIQKNIVYPQLAKLAGIEGKVYVLAFINEEGEVTDARIIKGIGAGCNEAAITAVKKVKFIPGRKNGELVKVKVTIPIVFKLQ